MTDSLAKQMFDNLDSELQGDPCWRYLRDLATPGHVKVLGSTARRIGVRSMQRSGKTTMLRAFAASYFRGIHPWRPRTQPVRLLVIAPSMMQLATIYKKGFFSASELYVTPEQAIKWPDLPEVVKKPLIPDSELARNSRGKPDIQWGNSKFGRVPGLVRHLDGSEMYFHISGDPNSWKRIEGMDFHAIFRDESIGDDNIGNTLVTRQMEWWNKPEYPNSGFYVWAATELTVTTERIEFMKACEEGKKHHAYFFLEASDNPKVSAKDREEAAAMLSPEEAAKRVYGTESAVSGQLVYGKHFKRARHVLTERYEPTASANLWAIWDPGLRHPYGLMGIAIEPDKPFKMVCDWFSFDVGKTIDYQANKLLEWLDGRALEGLIYDSSGATKSDYRDGKAAYVQMEEILAHAGLKIYRGMMPSSNQYKTTVPLVWRYLDPDPSNSSAEPLFVINAPAPGNGCETVIEQMYSFRYKEGRQAEMKAESMHKVNDEASDCVRYACSRQPRWVQRAPNPRRHQQAFTVSAPLLRSPLLDPLADDATLSDDMRRHRSMLRESRSLVRSKTSAGRAIMERYVSGL